MDGEEKDYAIGYGKPPVETRFQKGQSGNPGGRRRGMKSLPDLLGEALSRRSGFANPDGSWMTQAEAIFTVLVNQAAGPDLKAKRLLFDVMVKLQRANICQPEDHLPEIRLGDSEGDARAGVAADIERLTDQMRSEVAEQIRDGSESPLDSPSGEPPEPVTPTRAIAFEEPSPSMGEGWEGVIVPGAVGSACQAASSPPPRPSPIEGGGVEEGKCDSPVTRALPD